MTTDPRYPIGTFEAPAVWDTTQAAQWRQEIAELPARLRHAVRDLTDARLDTPYRDGGWTVRQLVHHVADSHVNAVCRFRLALTEETPTVKPYDEARWAELSDARAFPVEPSLQILDGTHARWSALLASLGSADLERTFYHPEQNKTMTLWRTLALYAWHCRHHVAQVTALRSRQGW